MIESTRYPGFEPHDLDSTHRFYTGSLPGDLLPGSKQFDVLWALHPPAPPLILIHGREVPAPRFQQAFGHDYRFSGRVSEALPVRPELEPFLTWARRAIDPGLNGLLVNWYEPGLGHYIGAHRDKTKGLIVGAPIVTISLGGARDFRLRPWKGKGFRGFPATDGSVFVLPYDSNAAWTHEVPHAARHTGRRISVTLRAFTVRGRPSSSAKEGAIRL
jgi:alkylated DNA repair dioxygenase AlkB